MTQYTSTVQAGSELFSRVERIVSRTPVADIHTHLYDPGFRSLLKWGIDELLVYHYLVSESFRAGPWDYDRFWASSTSQQAEWIWNRLFVAQSPLSEAARGVITTLNALGLDPRAGDLAALRQWFSLRSSEKHVEQVLEVAGVESICMTNSPFDPEETVYWRETPRRDPRFVGALRIDPLLLHWKEARTTLKEQGYDPGDSLNDTAITAIRRFLEDWTRRIESRYCMVSTPPDFAFPADTDSAWILEKAVLPHCREHGQAFAMMMGVRRGVNPQLRMAGDGVGQADLTALAALCRGFPENRFLVTCLSRECQQELVILARKFPNLHPFGCWWFNNTPQLIEETTTLRLDLLGTSFTFQHSDSRVLDQLIYKWKHSRAVLTQCLTRAYTQLGGAGWVPTDIELERDVRRLLGGSFDEFLLGDRAGRFESEVSRAS